MYHVLKTKALAALAPRIWCKGGKVTVLAQTDSCQSSVYGMTVRREANVNRSVELNGFRGSRLPLALFCLQERATSRPTPEQ